MESNAQRMSNRVLLGLVLQEMEGVGQVTAGRLLASFDTYEALLSYPREQVLVRIKGVAHAEALVHRLFDRAAMAPFFDTAEKKLETLRKQRVEVLVQGDDRWPPGMAELPRGHRPFLLYAYGHTSVLQRLRVALLAHPPLDPEAFERAQAVVDYLLLHQRVPATGAAHGFDVVVHKLCSGERAAPSILVAAEGLAQIAPPLRPVASGVVRSGGLLLSPFEMNHGPFAHDKHTGALVLTALADVAVFVDPTPETPEWEALLWTSEAGRPVFVIPSKTTPTLPPPVQIIRNTADTQALLGAG